MDILKNIKKYFKIFKKYIKIYLIYKLIKHYVYYDGFIFILKIFFLF